MPAKVNYQVRPETATSIESLIIRYSIGIADYPFEVLGHIMASFCIA